MSVLLNHQKHKICEEVAIMCKKTSQANVAFRARVSGATINKMARMKLLNISDEMFRKVKTNLRIELEWNTAQITNFEMIQKICNLAQRRSISLAISEYAGRGKTEGFKFYERSHRNVIYLECKNIWTRKEYMKNLCSASGLDTHGTLMQVVNRFLDHIKGLSGALIIIDQFDKLRDSQMDLFMDFYNEMNGSCGFMISGVRHLEKRVLRGVNRSKIGYEELYSRIGRKFIRLDPISLEDVEKVCLANGLKNEDLINEIFHTCEGDLRRVKREVEKYHEKVIEDHDVIFEEVLPSEDTTGKHQFEIPEEVFKTVAESSDWDTPAEAVRIVRLMHPKAWQNDEILFEKIKPYIFNKVTSMTNGIDEAVGFLKNIHPETNLSDDDLREMISLFAQKEEVIA